MNHRLTHHPLRSALLACTLLLGAGCTSLRGPAPVSDAHGEETRGRDRATTAPSAPGPAKEPAGGIKPSVTGPAISRPGIGAPDTTTSPNTITPRSNTGTPSLSAVASLLDQGWHHYHQGDYRSALALAERAQALDPRDPASYLLLGRAHLAGGQAQLAEQLARRGLALSQASSKIGRQLQVLFDQALTAR